MTLTDFLLARIAEDEVNATLRQWHHEECEHIPQPGSEYTYPCGCGVPERMKRECEAKRRIVELHESWPVLVQSPPSFGRVDGDPDSVIFQASQQVAWLTEQEYRTKFGDEPPTAPMLAALAAVYADHPDYREEWRP